MGQASSREQQPRPIPRPRRIRGLRPTSIFRQQNDAVETRNLPPSSRERASRWYEGSNDEPRLPTSSPSPPPHAISTPQRNPTRLSRARRALTSQWHQHRISRVTASAPTPRDPSHSRSEQSPERLAEGSDPPPNLLGDPGPSNLSASLRPGTSESRRSNGRPASSIADRISNLTPARRDISRLTASIRRGRSRRGAPEDSAAMLTRLLSVAAAATAASLMGGNPETAVNDLRRAATAVDGDDGDFHGFLQALRSGGLANHLGRNQSQNSGSNGETRDHNPGSLDFFRMFRFGTSANNRRNAGSRSRSRNSVHDASTDENGDAPDENGEGRMVPVLIVGIRSLNNEQETGPDQADAMPSFIDALQNFPTTINIGLSNQSPDGEEASRSQRSSMRLGQRRRASMGGLNLFSGNRENARRSFLSDTSRPRPLSEVGTSASPLGSQAPTTSPSSPPISSRHSGASTPVLPPSNLGAAEPEQSTHDATPSRSARHSILDPTVEEPAVPRMTRQRRMSMSDFRRHRSGSARRNGVVEPDNAPSDREGNRSWIIYVLGGSYPENHPILTTPSLFTDSPTYEDMLLLSSLLGPVKPPVASDEDLDAAGGLFDFLDIEGRPAARSADGQETIVLVAEQKCLICLSQYETGETGRKLKTCGHLFHKDCIDHWLLNGRNSCPLCRGQGVDEKEKPSEESAGEGPSTAPAVTT